MQKWEYKRVDIETDVIDDELNKLGEDGWELVTIVLEGNYYCAIFKRLQSL